MGRALLLAAVIASTAAAGCQAKLAEQEPADAAGGGGDDAAPGVDAAPPIDAAPDGPTCSNGRVVYLNFDGQALQDAAVSDATLNRASWMTIPNGTAPPFRQGVGTRAADIQFITDGIRQILAALPVTVVTTRPATGPYVMIVFGGAPGDVGSQFTLAVNELDCDDSEKSDVMWIGNATGVPLQRIVNVAVGGIGFGLGLTATTDPSDCLCGWGNSCTPTAAQPCTLSTSIARDGGALQTCAGAASPQDELAFFDAAFCQ